MHGHQLHLVMLRLCVAVGKKGNMGQIVFHHGFLPTGGLVLVNRLLQFCQIVQSLLVPLCAQHSLIPGQIQSSRKDL